MKKLLLVFSVLAVTLLAACSGQLNTDINIDDNDSDSQASGEVLVSMTDARADMESVSEIELTTKSTSIYSQSQGWVEIDNKQRTYALYDLNSRQEFDLMARQDVSSEQYSRVRFDIERVVIVHDDGTRQEARVPSDRYQIYYNFNVDESQSTVIELDIFANESLHMTGNGEYILAPVATVKATNNADYVVRSNGAVHVNTGQAQAMKRVGMDIDGNVGLGLGIASDAVIDTNIIGGLSVRESSSASGSSSESTNSDTSASGSVSGSGSSDSGSIGGSVDGTASVNN